MIRQPSKINCVAFKTRVFVQGFTLIELMVVVIILGILVAIAVPRYIRIVEKGRVSEAKYILGRIRSAEAAYFAEYDVYSMNFATLGLQLPTSCNSSCYYSYGVDGTGAFFTARATRCTSNGKNPNHSGAAYEVNLTQAGVIGGDPSYI